MTTAGSRWMASKYFFLEGVAGFRGNKHFPGEQMAAAVFRGDGFLGSQSFIDAHGRFGDVCNHANCEWSMTNWKSSAGVYIAVLALRTLRALHVEKSLVDAQKGRRRERASRGRGSEFAGYKFDLENPFSNDLYCRYSARNFKMNAWKQP